MRDYFKDYSEFHGSDLFSNLWESPKSKQDRVFKSTRLEREIYSDLSAYDEQLRSICERGKSQLPTFQSLTQDVFTGFYSLSPRQCDDGDLSPTAKRFNKPIIEKAIASDEFITLKSICEGREMPSYDASVEFSETICDNLPELTESLRETKTLEMLDKQAEQLQSKLQDLCGENDVNPSENSEKKILQAANRLQKKSQQIADLEQKAADSLLKATAKMNAAVKQAVEAAVEKAQETDDLLRAWGNDSATPEDIKANEEIISKVRRNPKLLEISRILGRYLKMLADKRMNSFEYGLGQKYDITTGKNLNLCLSSELALLAAPETQPLFIKKFMGGKLKQYRRREREIKGQGDIIVCVDESSSMKNAILWAKALAFCLLDIAAKAKRNFALVRFSDLSKTHYFRPGAFTTQDIFAAVDGFLRGGTNFENPLREITLLISGNYFGEGSSFENADVLFITDGECAITAAFAEFFSRFKHEKGFTVQGVLLNKDDPTAGRSLEPFCDKIYRESDFDFDEIADKIIGGKV